MAVVATGNLFIPRLSDNTFLDPSVLALGATVVVALILWIRGGLFFGGSHLLVIACLAGFIPGFVNAGENTYATSKLVGLTATAIIILVSMQLLQGVDRQRSFLVVTTVLGCLVTVQLYGFGIVLSGGRATLAGLNEIGVGRMGTLSALVILAWALNQYGRRRISLLAIAVMVAFVSTSTGSRGPLLSAVIAILLTVMITRSTGRVARTVILGAIVISVYYAVELLGDPDTATRLVSGDSSNRTRIWAESLHTFLEHPFGIGFGNLYQYITVDASMATSGYSQYSHNMLLEAATEGGVTALLGLLLLLIFSFRALRRQAHTTTGEVLLAVFLYAVANALLSSDLVGDRLMWVMIASGVTVQLTGVGASSARMTSFSAPGCSSRACALPGLCRRTPPMVRENRDPEEVKEGLTLNRLT